MPTAGQVGVLNSETVFTVGTAANIFVEVDRSVSYDGAGLSLPAGWQLEQVNMVHRGREIGVSWFGEGNGAYRLSFDESGSGPHQLVLRVRVPDFESDGEMAFVPSSATESGGYRPVASKVQHTLVAERRHLESANMVANFDASTRLDLMAANLPFSHGDRSFTLEFWIKTTGLNQIVMSGWDGDEDSEYPAEVVVASDGRLLFFRGRLGRHVAMTSGIPVADGTWHHVAVAHDEVRRWSRLLVDAVPRDSLFGENGTSNPPKVMFCVGGRCVQKGDGPLRGFSGQLDDLRIWPLSRTNRQIRATMVEHLPTVPGVIAISFEDRPATPFVVGADNVARAPSDFLHFDPVRDLTVSHVGDDVEIQWFSGGKSTESFVVERSPDGRSFVELQTYDPDQGASGRFVHREEHTIEGVAYYRIRQELVNGGVRYSGTVKIGVGGDELPDMAMGVVLGNFPNPFSSATTISFEVADPQHVRVSVWDLAGHQVASVLDASVSPGRHEVTFVPGDLPSGTYFARLESEAGVSTRKITLAR